MLATATIPLDLTSVAGDLAEYIGTAAGVGLGVFAAFLGIRYVIKAFRSVAK